MENHRRRIYKVVVEASTVQASNRGPGSHFDEETEMSQEKFVQQVTHIDQRLLDDS